MPFAFLFGLYVNSSVFHDLSMIIHVSISFRGVLSTGFLWMVDVDKSRVECDEFVLAESARKAFDTKPLDIVST
jgi:hypothetical protein